MLCLDPCFEAGRVTLNLGSQIPARCCISLTCAGQSFPTLLQAANVDSGFLGGQGITIFCFCTLWLQHQDTEQIHTLLSLPPFLQLKSSWPPLVETLIFSFFLCHQPPHILYFVIPFGYFWMLFIFLSS